MVEKAKGSHEAIVDNTPDLWRSVFPRLARDGHKYDRGDALIFAGGLEGVGAARLAARAALRAGAGLVTLAVPGAALMGHAGRPPDALMVRQCDGLDDIKAIFTDERFKAALIGPAFGVGASTRRAVEVIMNAGRCTVIDADALTSFAGTSPDLASLIELSPGPTVITPHEGEFSRLLEDIPTRLSRIERACLAAKRIHAVVVLKGAETIIAAPNGRAAVNQIAPADLATAGSGDVLAGIIVSLLAQGMPPFEAACAAVWLHGQAGISAGPGLIADDLPEAIRGHLAKLRA